MRTRKNFKCPKCGGPCNSWQPVGIKGKKVIIVCECWSGSIHGDKGPDYEHVYTKTIPLKSQDGTKHKGSKYNQFVKEKYAEGITDFKEIGRLWQKQKQEVIIQ